MRPWSRALATLAAAGALVGCGGRSEEEVAYVEGVNAAQQRFATTVERLSGAVTPTSSERSDRVTFRRYRQAVDRVVAELRAVRPPAEVAPLHGTLVRTLADFGRDVDIATDALDERDPDRVRDARRALQRSTRDASRRIDDTLAQINAEL
jgi:hypothetical protein